MRDLTFTDGPMFQHLMGNEEICKGVVERVLGLKVTEVENIVTEQSIEPRLGSHGVRLDAMMAADGRTYDVEVQTYQQGRLARRLRYYQASLDVTALGKGRDYDLLPETYVAFICTGDFLGTKLPISTLDICCREALDFDCRHGFRWVILDASRWREVAAGPLRDLLAFVDTGRAPGNDELIDLIESEMAEANANARWKESMMPFLTVEDDARIQASISYEDGRSKGLAEGRSEGLAEGRSEGLAEGRSEGEAAMAALMERLFAEGRTVDAQRAAVDSDVRTRLLKEYGL